MTPPVIRCTPSATWTRIVYSLRSTSNCLPAYDAFLRGKSEPSGHGTPRTHVLPISEKHANRLAAHGGLPHHAVDALRRRRRQLFRRDRPGSDDTQPALRPPVG